MNRPEALTTRPVPLTDGHDLAPFDCGDSDLNDWLRHRAQPNNRSAASRTYVVCAPGTVRVVGFYAVSMGQIVNQDAAGAMRRNMPHHIPAVVLGRLAVDLNWQRRDIGSALLQDAVGRALRASGEVAARLLVVHAISPEAERFYLRHGFTHLPVDYPAYAIDLVKYKVAGTAI